MKVLLSHFQQFFFVSRNKTNIATDFLQYFDFYGIVTCVFSQLFWLHARIGNTTIFSLVWHYRSITLAFSTVFFVSRNKTNIATDFLQYFDSFGILTCVFSQQFRLHARTSSRPYSRLCGKMKVLLSHFQYFFC